MGADRSEGALSGCGVLESDDSEVVLDHVTVRNLDDRDHVVDVEVRITDAGEIALWLGDLCDC